MYLENALAADARVKILRTLFQEAFPQLDAAALADETGKSRAGVHRALREISPTGILAMHKRGRTTFYAVDTEHPWARPLADLFRAERTADNVPHLFPTYWNHLEGVVSQLAASDDVAFVLLYGSLTRSPVRPTADVDLFVGVRSGGEPPTVEARVLNHEVSVVAMEMDRVNAKLKSTDPFLESVLERHVVLHKAPDVHLPWRPGR